jgi:hypothetical protein
MNAPRRTPEHRWPAAAAVLAVLVLWALLPSTFLPWLRYGAVALGVIALAPLVVINPHRMSRETRWSRGLSLGLSLTLLAVNQVFLVQLVYDLLEGAQSEGILILRSALQVWVTNVIVFALVFWELDRGGPVARNEEQRSLIEPADFRFPQDEDHDAIDEVAARSAQRANWRPSFMDYLYSSVTDGIAFSAADAMPLSHRAKLLMAIQALSAYIIGLLVVARAVAAIG